MSKAKLLALGSVTRVSQTLISIVVSFLMMPFLVNELGNYWYGIWAIITSITAAYHLFDLGMASAVTRYFSYAIGKDDSVAANKVVSTAFIVYSGIATLIILATFGFALVPGLFIEDPSQGDILFWLIVISGSSVALEFPFNSLAGIPQAKLKFHYVALIRIFVTLISAVGVYFAVINDHGLIGMAIIIFITSRVSNVLYFIVSKKVFPELKISKALFDKVLLKEMFSYSTWSFIISIAQMARTNLDNILVAALISIPAVTTYAIAIRLIELSAQLLSQATNMFNPTFTQYVAQGKSQELKRDILFVTKINVFSSMIFCLGLLLFSGPFISIWMGPEHSSAYTLIVILACTILITVSNQSIVTALMASNKHKLVAIVDAIGIPAKIGFCVLFTFWYKQESIAIGSALAIILFRGLILPYYAAKAVDIKFSEYYSTFALPFIVSTAIGVPFFFILESILFSSYFQILLLGAIVGMTQALSLYLLTFSTQEKERLLTILPLVKKLKNR